MLDSIYLRIQKIKSILNVLFHNQSNGSKCVIDVCRTRPTFEKTDLGHVRQRTVIKVKTLNGSEHHGRSFFSFFFIEIENFRSEGQILMRHTHDTTFSEKILDFYKILEESEQFFIFIFKENGKSEAVFQHF